MAVIALMLRLVRKVVTTERFAIAVSKESARHTALTVMQQVIQRKTCVLRVANVHAMEMEMQNKKLAKNAR